MSRALLLHCIVTINWQTLRHNGIQVPVRTSFGLHWRGGTMYQRKVDVDMLNAVKSVLTYCMSCFSFTHSLWRSAYPHQP